jgi:hypothetical protein
MISVILGANETTRFGLFGTVTPWPASSVAILSEADAAEEEKKVKTTTKNKRQRICVIVIHPDGA